MVKLEDLGIYRKSVDETYIYVDFCPWYADVPEEKKKDLNYPKGLTYVIGEDCCICKNEGEGVLCPYFAGSEFRRNIDEDDTEMAINCIYPK